MMFEKYRERVEKAEETREVSRELVRVRYETIVEGDPLKGEEASFIAATAASFGDNPRETYWGKRTFTFSYGG